MNRTVELTIPGTPATQGSKRHVGGGRLIEMDKRLPAWRATVNLIARRELGHGFDPLDGPLSVQAVFYLPKPKRPKFQQPATPGDLDKYQRALGDALTLAGVIVDDARIVHWDARKTYATHTTGCLVTIQETE